MLSKTHEETFYCLRTLPSISFAEDTGPIKFWRHNSATDWGGGTWGAWGCWVAWHEHDSKWRMVCTKIRTFLSSHHILTWLGRRMILFMQIVFCFLKEIFLRSFHDESDDVRRDGKNSPSSSEDVDNEGKQCTDPWCHKSNVADYLQVIFILGRNLGSCKLYYLDISIKSCGGSALNLSRDLQVRSFYWFCMVLYFE